MSDTDYSTWHNDELDVTIAVRVFDWTSPRITSQNRLAGTPRGTDYRETMGRPSEDAAAMLLVIEAMRKRGWWCRIESPCGDEATWMARFAHPLQVAWRSVSRDSTPQRAVCIAALRALDSMEDHHEQGQ